MELKLRLNQVGLNLAGLLIVPYGIETTLAISFFMLSSLLIVPYGIETKVKRTEVQHASAFNRTLWN